MNDSATSQSDARPRLLTFGSAGWVLALAALLGLAIVTWRGIVIFRSLSIPVVGDGRTVASYGFDLDTCLVPADQLVAAGFPKDGLPVLSAPTVLTIADADALTEELRKQHLGKFMVARQRVLGITINGQARAYPLKILTWHELVNDELGGVPIAVTYNPLCYSAAVFDRRVEGELLEFGVSGLLYNSNPLLYDQRADGLGESLWSQLQFRAIAGPGAERGARLNVLPMQLMRWGEWKAAHPDTTVLAPDMSRIKVYKRSYGEYFGSPKLRFPVEPLPPVEPDQPAYKEPVIAVWSDARWHAFTWEQIAARVDEAGTWQTTVGGQPLRFMYQRDIALKGDPAVAWVETDDGTALPPVTYSFWFAWYAHHPEARDLVE